jgi:protein-tyrosine sulfotransferase
VSNKKDGIVILGAPRSGTTLLRRLLNAHPNIACPGETYLLSSCARFLRSDRLADGANMGVLSGLNFAGFERDLVLGELREFAFSFLRRYAEQQGKARWAEKTAIDVFYLEEIEALCGDQVQFVCLSRHGLDVAASCEELVATNGAIPLELHDYVRGNNKPLEAYCEAWVHATRSMLDFAERHSDNSIVCRYEDLVVDPEAVLRRIFSQLDEQWDDGLLQRALSGTDNPGFGDWKTYRSGEVLGSSVGRWKSLSPPVVARLAGIVNDTLTDAGYEAVAVEPAATDDAEAQRRYELGLLIQASREN